MRKLTTRPWLFVCAVVLCAAANVPALELAGKAYVTAEAGAAFMHDMHVADTPASLEFDPGVRGTAVFGYNLNNDATAELETGVIWNSVKRFGPFDEDAAVYQVPLLVNLIYKLPITYRSPVRGRLVPYVGIGLGGVLSTIDVSTPQGSFSADDFTFAYQPFAGVRYALTDRWDISIAYKFFGSLDYDWTSGPLDRSVDGAMVHNFLAGISFKF